MSVIAKLLSSTTLSTFGFIVLNGVNHLRFYLNSDLEKTELREELNQLLK